MRNERVERLVESVWPLATSAKQRLHDYGQRKRAEAVVSDLLDLHIVEEVEDCPACEGVGTEEDATTPCFACRGKGYVIR